MKTYSVKQIAEMLNTNPETVRRWIRDGKLEATQYSKKGGNIVEERALQAFLDATPKYAPKRLDGALMMGALAITGGVVGAVMGFIAEKKTQDFIVSSDDFKKFLNNRITADRESIEQKRGEIKRLEKEIASLQSKDEQYEYLLSHDDIIDATLSELKQEEN